MSKSTRGLMIVGTDTGVGKTYVTCLIARALRASGKRVGVYKPVASGCLREGDTLVSEDARELWRAAGQSATLEEVCPQRFAAPLAPHLAARAEGREVDPDLLRRGLDVWLDRSEIVLVEGAGGLMSPLTDDEYVADLAADFGFPLVVVTRNALGTINQTLQALIAAAAFGDGLPIAGIVLNHEIERSHDASLATNRAELAARCVPPILAEAGWNAAAFDSAVDWYLLAQSRETVPHNLSSA
jgi:dethiobiotin synthetase